MKRYILIALFVLLGAPFFFISQARAQVVAPSPAISLPSPTATASMAEEQVVASPVQVDTSGAATPTPLPATLAPVQVVTETVPVTAVPTITPTIAVKPTIRPTSTPAPVLTLQTFARSIANGNKNELVGVFALQVFALRVKSQPTANSAYVYPEAGTATLFGVPMQYGTTALMAHNYLAGAQFSALTPGREVSLIYGDGSVRTYRIARQLKFQALSPQDPYSKFIDLGDKSRTLSSDDLFRQVYMSAGNLVFQTCIAAQGNSSWGRLFVIAEPM